MAPKRGAPEKPSDVGVKVKKPRVAGGAGASSSLVPMEARKLAVKGKREPDMLRMLCWNNDKEERKELHFKKIVHADIDWDNKEHIDLINAWRVQIYGRAGIKNKIVVMWHKDEEAWLELYWLLLAVEANKRGVQLPRPKTIREAFNAFFKGKIFHSAGGKQREPRGNREGGPFTSKMARLVKSLKADLEKKDDKRWEPFFPKINQEMLSEYQKLKADLVKLGCVDTGIIPWDEVRDGFNYTEPVVRCRQYLSALPDQKDVALDDEEDATLVGSKELDEELLELATEPEGQVKTEPRNTDDESSSVTVHETAIATEELSVADNDTTPKKRADSVAATVATTESSELTLFNDEVTVDEGKDQGVIETREAVQGMVIAVAEREAAATLISLFGL